VGEFPSSGTIAIGDGFLMTIKIREIAACQAQHVKESSRFSVPFD
jgi:hypothetical protein